MAAFILREPQRALCSICASMAMLRCPTLKVKEKTGTKCGDASPCRQEVPNSLGLTLDRGLLHANGSGMIPLMGWVIDPHRPFHVEGQFRGADVVDLADRFSKLKLPVVREKRLRVGLDRGND